MEQLIFVCVVLLAVGLALALVRERRLRIAMQILLRRLLSFRRNEHVQNSEVSARDDAGLSERV